jgi:hypothetical protein
MLTPRALTRRENGIAWIQGMLVSGMFSFENDVAV